MGDEKKSDDEKLDAIRQQVLRLFTLVDALNVSSRWNSILGTPIFVTIDLRDQKSKNPSTGVGLYSKGAMHSQLNLL